MYRSNSNVVWVGGSWLDLVGGKKYWIFFYFFSFFEFEFEFEGRYVGRYTFSRRILWVERNKAERSGGVWSRYHFQTGFLGGVGEKRSFHNTECKSKPVGGLM